MKTVRKLSNNVTDHPVEFEDDAPLELKESSSDTIATDNFSTTGPSESLEKVIQSEKQRISDRNAKIKETPVPLRITKKKIMKTNYQPKDYIAVACAICEREFTHAKKDDNGAFVPYALCQHIVFKGIVEVE
jgi:hypothetical protein